MTDHLQQQGGIYHVRLSIPKDVQKAFGGRKILSQSLKTGLRSEAMTRRLSYLTHWKSQIEKARDKIANRGDEWKEDLSQFSGLFSSTIRNLKISNMDGESAPLPTIDPELFNAWRQYYFDDPVRGPQRRQELDEIHKLHGLDEEIKLLDFSRKLFMDFAGDVYEEEQGLSSSESELMRDILSNPKQHKPKSPITKTRLASFRAFREKMNVSPKNVDQQESKLLKLSAFLTETGNPLDFDCVAAWLDTLKTSSKTKQQYLNAGNTFWKWAMKYDTHWREDNKNTITPFERHDLPQLKGKDRVDAQRLAFELDDLSTLHAAAHKKGLHALADLILLGAYTGARIEELCQLRTEHIITVEGVQSFNITDSKTAAGIRVVPVHPALTVTVQRLMDDSKNGYLVPSDSRNQYGKRSDLLSKAFGRLKTSLQFGPLHVFHSIRKTAITQLVRASVTGTLIAELVGHETGTVTYDVYSQGASAAQKLEAIAKLPILPPLAAPPLMP